MTTSALTPARIDLTTAWSVAIIAITILAWIVTLFLQADRGHGLGIPQHDFPTFVVSWVIMLTAMMIPSELRYVRAYSTLIQTGSTRRQEISYHFLCVSTFVMGYGIAWIAYGMLAFILAATLRITAFDIVPWNWTGSGVTGWVFILAGLYQISPLKKSCLTHCRSPLSYFSRNWRTGPTGALQMGVKHGLVCVGCCWALMAVMFVVGAINLLWMGLLTLLMFAEKILPAGHRLVVPVTIILWLVGVWIAVFSEAA